MDAGFERLKIVASAEDFERMVTKQTHRRMSSNSPKQRFKQLSTAAGQKVQKVQVEDIQISNDRSTTAINGYKEELSCGHRNVNTSVKAGSLKSNNEIEPLRRCIVLDIEGTTTPISFVSDVLFPYACDNVGRHLDATYDTAETQDDIKLLRSQVQDDLEQGIAGAVPIPSDDAGKEEIIPALVANVEAMIKADRKITALKQLQVYIYSSGSRLAQRLIFGNTNYGDLRKYLCGFFDTIACLEVIISVRPGNGPLPENHGFKTINSFSEIQDLGVFL
ncbi:hypothetical protein HYC85_001432 [Camellia sinensis]|uniref:Uncharacterized protein n=1 Tax=Camellia sinensis TaxID=4442 RepID=A0A7J7I5F1_CAMSI|nr:hypothetical protein HYC85_001432 [Camellia sinensis]